MDTVKLDKIIAEILLELYLEGITRDSPDLPAKIHDLLNFHKLVHLSSERAYVRVRVAKHFRKSFHSEKYI